MKFKKAAVLLPLFIFYFASFAYCANETVLKSSWTSQSNTGGTKYQLREDVVYGSAMPAVTEQDVFTPYYTSWPEWGGTWTNGPSNLNFSVKSASYTMVFVSTAPNPIMPWLPPIDVYVSSPTDARFAVDANKKSSAFTFITGERPLGRGTLVKHDFEYLTITNGLVTSTNTAVKGGGAYGNYYYNYQYDQSYSTYSYNMTNRTIDFKDIHFISNIVRGNNEANGANVYGGAVFIGGYSSLTGTTPSISVTFSSGTQFIGNNSSGYGGAYASLYNGINTVFGVFIDTFTYEAITDGEGNVVGVSSSPIVISDFTLFESNKAGKDGGAVYFKGGQGSTITFKGASVFSSNSSGGSGGAVYYEKMNTGGTLVFGNGNYLGYSPALFINNTAGGYGGAIYSSNTAVLFYDGALFFSNTGALGGGAIYVTKGDIAFSSHSATVFYNNSTSNNSNANGGAIYKGNVSAMSFDAGIYFTSNTAGGSGGAIYNAGGGITFSSNAYITGNKTQFGSGGAIYSAGGAITFFNAIELVRNASGDAGGAIYVSSGAVSFLSSAGIFGNSAYGHGGAIYGGQGGSFSFQSETDFTENKSLLGAGGAIYKLMSSAADGITFNQSVSFTTNTAALGGGAIYSSGRGLVTFNNSASFRGNSVTDESSQLSAGGAIYADSIIYRFYGNAVFEQNSAALSRGGAIYAQASTFTFSSAASFYANIVKGANLEGGAAIYSVGSYFDFQSDATIFSGNKTSEDTQVSGGAIYALYSNYKFKQAVFTDNSATDKGGAIALIDCDTVFTGNVRFERNSAAAGGALYLGHLAGSSNLVNFNGQVLFQYNNSLKWNLIGGGAILLNASTGSLQINFAQIASFNYNESAANGGAFTIYSGAQNTINFSGVTNFDDNAAAANGGAFYSLIYGTGKGEYNFTNSGYFADNTAGNSGGAIFAHGNNKFTIDSSFYFGSNFAGGTDANGGGAIFSSLSTFTFSGSQAVEFEYNEASSRGGAVYQENGLFDFQSSADFKFNSAGVSGGAVYASYGAMTFNRSVSFTSNTASGDLLTSGGGALYAFEQTLRFLANTNFENNSAKGITNGSGGAIYASKSNLSFTGTGTASFSNNEALFRGGAFYQNEGTSVFKSIPAIFTNNVAGSEGGAVYLAGKGTIEFTNAQFISNSAGVNGGAIYIKGASSSNISEIYFNQTVSALTLFNANTANGFANSMHFAGNSYVEFTVLQNQTLNVNDGFTAAGRNNLVTLKGGGTFNMNDNISGFESLNLNLDNISFNLADGKNMSLNNLSVLNGSVLNMQQSFDGQTVSVSGDLTLDYMSELRLCVISGGDCDVIDVGGKAFLDGTVSVKAGVGTYDNEWFTLINAADGFEDTDFAVKFLDDSGIHQTDPCPLKYTFEFDETQKRFMLVINGIRQSYFSQLDGLGRNQKNAAAMYDALSANASRPLANVINSITDMSTVSQQAALLETAPYFIANALNYRLHNRSKRDLFNNIEKSDKTNNIWAYADGGGSLVFQSDINSPGDFETADYGAVFGADKKLSPDFILGFYGKYNIANISQGKSEGNIASYGLGTYALANKDAWQFKAALGYEGQSYDITRSIVNVGSDTIRSAKTEFNSYLLEADIEASYDIPVSKVFSLSPFAGINGSWAHYGSFDETGADVLSLEIEGSNSFVTNTRLGISANMKVSSKLDLRLSAEYDRLFSGYLPELNVKLNGETEVFETVGSETGRDIFGFNLYASYNINENVKTYASGTIKTAQNLSSLGGTLGVKYSF